MRISDWSSDVCSSDLAPQHFFRATGHAFELGFGFLRPGDADHLDLAELVLTQHAARILACRSGLRPETLRPGSDPQRQVRRLEDATGDDAGQRHFRGGNEPVIVSRSVEIIAEFRKLARFVTGSGAGPRRRPALGITRPRRVKS